MKTAFYSLVLTAFVILPLRADLTIVYSTTVQPASHGQKEQPTPSAVAAATNMTIKVKGDKARFDKPRLTPTGQRETINGYETEQYTYDGPDFKAMYWIAPNYPNGAAVLAQLQSIKSEFWDAANTKMPDFRDFPGL